MIIEIDFVLLFRRSVLDPKLIIENIDCANYSYDNLGDTLNKRDGVDFFLTAAVVVAVAVEV